MERRVDPDSNICSTCKEDAGDNHLPCARCRCSIHVIDCGGLDRLCTQTFRDNWTATSKYKNIKFLCDSCLEAMEEPATERVDVQNQERITEFQVRLNKLNDEFNELLQTQRPGKSKAKPNPKPQASRDTGHPDGGDSDSAAADTGGTADTGVTAFRDLSSKDKSRSRIFGKNLRTLSSLSNDTDTLLILDSNGRNLDPNQMDPTGHTETRWTGGLCLPAAVYGLKHYKRRHPNVKQVLYGVGTNDALHSEEHAPNERSNYIRMLHRESARIFPEAKVSFILPPPGITNVDIGYIDSLARDIKGANVPIRQLRSPGMRGKLQRDKVHLTRDGVQSMTEWLQRVLPQRPRTFSASSGRRSDPSVFSSNPSVFSSNRQFLSGLQSEPTQGNTSSFARAVSHTGSSGPHSAPSTRSVLYSNSDHVPSAPPRHQVSPTSNSPQPQMMQDVQGVLEIITKLLGNR